VITHDHIHAEIGELVTGAAAAALILHAAKRQDIGINVLM
jgi:hypothetical protein